MVGNFVSIFSDIPYYSGKEVKSFAHFYFWINRARPYYDNWKEQINDRHKITTYFTILNNFITRIDEEIQSEFQFIVVEHIPKEI